MSEIIEFRVAGVPKANREKAIKIAGHASIRRTEETIEWVNWVKLNAMKYEQEPLLDSPLLVYVDLVFRRKQFNKSAGWQRQWHTVKPDTSNCLKTVEDGVKGIITVDDDRHVILHGEKWYAAENESPHARIIIGTVAEHREVWARLVEGQREYCKPEDLIEVPL